MKGHIWQLRLLEAEFNQKRSEALSQIQAKQAEIIQTFSDNIKPIAMEEAKSIKKSAVVLAANVFDYDDSIDVTDATIKAAIKAGLKMEAPAATEDAKEEGQ